MAQRQQHSKQNRAAPYKLPPKPSGGAQKNPDGSVTIPDHVDIGQVHQETGWNPYSCGAQFRCVDLRAREFYMLKKIISQFKCFPPTKISVGHTPAVEIEVPRRTGLFCVCVCVCVCVC